MMGNSSFSQVCSIHNQRAKKWNTLIKLNPFVIAVTDTLLFMAISFSFIDEFCGETTLAFASSCDVEFDYFRPITGYINICPNVSHKMIYI